MHALPATRPLTALIARLMPEVSRYTLASVAALAVDLGVFNGLLWGHLQPALAGIAGYGAGLLLHYVLSRRFVFSGADPGKSDLRRFGEFVLTGCVGLLLTWAVISIATGTAHLPAIIGKAAAVAASFIVVFLLRRGLVFAGRNNAWSLGHSANDRPFDDAP